MPFRELTTQLLGKWFVLFGFHSENCLRQLSFVCSQTNRCRKVICRVPASDTSIAQIDVGTDGRGAAGTAWVGIGDQFRDAFFAQNVTGLGRTETQVTDPTGPGPNKI